MDGHPLWLLPFLAAAGFVAGWLGALTGAGGLVALPVLLAVGVPAHLALGTNMLQSSVGTVAAAVGFLRLRSVTIRDVRPGAFSTIAGAAIGVVAVHHVPAQHIRNLLPVVLLGIVILLLLARRLSCPVRWDRCWHHWYWLIQADTNPYSSCSAVWA